MTKQPKNRDSKELSIYHNSMPELTIIEKGDIDNSNIPDEFKEESIQEIHSLNPTVTWERVSDFIVGTYLGTQEEIGPNHSNLHSVQLDPSLYGIDNIISIWGSTILDRKISLANLRGGEKILVKYLGEVPTLRGMNPAKNFQLLIKRSIE